MSSTHLQKILNLEAEAFRYLQNARDSDASAKNEKNNSGKKRHFSNEAKRYEILASQKLNALKREIRKFPSANVRAILNATTTGKKKGIFGRFFGGGPDEFNAARRRHELKALANAYKAQINNHVQKHSNVYPNGISHYGTQAIEQVTEYVSRHVPPMHERNGFL